MLALPVLVDLSHEMCSLTLAARRRRMLSAGMKLVLSSYSWSKSCEDENGISVQFMAIVYMYEVISRRPACTPATLVDVLSFSSWLIYSHQCGNNLDLTLLLRK